MTRERYTVQQPEAVRIKRVVQNKDELPLQVVNNPPTLANNGFNDGYVIQMYDTDKEEDKQRGLWKTEFDEFCQNTSIHGIRQIHEPQPFAIRR